MGFGCWVDSVVFEFVVFIVVCLIVFNSIGKRLCYWLLCGWLVFWLRFCC